MSSNEPKEIQIKELGNLQERVLFFLSENPDNNKQAIQKGISHPSDQYGSVLNAVNALEKIGYIQAKSGFSKKKVPISLYNCTDLGVFYALSKNPNGDAQKLLSAYGDRETWKSVKALYDEVGHETFASIFKDASDFIPMISKDGFENALIFLFARSYIRSRKLNPKTRRKAVKAAIKCFPELKSYLKEWRDSIDEIL
jgi:hypothetical protein